ncbi:PREDICTED: afadin-like [Papilio xuthus]|uniref:Afadin-like n=1 Tax=Papilio xuthus TaxID=66420 RepID=A0AAJ6ZQZ7_PAPXU|nr:PREDICTED: afadin-like [Papilio xuthus]
MEADRDKRMLEREVLRNMIQQWNANRLDLFELSEPNENLEFHGVMRFYFQDSGQKIATKCIRVASDATVSDVIETLIEKFRPDMRMLSLGSYSLWETHGPDYERRLEPHEKPLLVQLNWHTDDREGRFLLKCLTNNEVPLSSVNEKSDQNFKRKLSKREKKELKKKEKLSRLKSDTNDENRPIAEKLYTELPETSFTRSISNPEAVMRRRRQQKLERKLQQFRSKDGGPDTGGTLKIYGSSLCPDVPYKTLLLSVGDTAAAVVREMLEKYGLSRHEPHHYCIVQVDTADNSEYILEDDECPLAIVMTHPHRSSIMFHVRRRPADSQPRRRKKKAGGAARPGTEPLLVEVAPDGSALENGRRMRLADVLEVGSGNGTGLQLYGPSIQPRHCVVAPADGGYSVTPLHPDAQVYLNGRRVTHTQRLQHGCLVKFGRVSTFRFVDPAQENLMNRNLAQSQNYGSGSIYDRSPTSAENSGAMSPTSLASHHADLDTNSNANVTNDTEYPGTASPVSHDAFAYRDGNDTMSPYNNNTLKLDNESLMMSQHLSDSKDDYMRDEPSAAGYADQEQSAAVSRTGSHYKDNYETTFDLDGNVETKSICSAKSGGSGHDNRVSTCARPGQEAILPAVLEFPEAGQAQFLAAVITRLDPHAPAFKLAPVYTLYLCARYRASTHYRPELTPTERAHKLTAFLHHVATLIHATVQERCTDSAAQAFWMANASELLHFLKCDRHISSFSTQAQELLPQTVQNAFSNLVTCFQEELGRALVTLNSPAGEGGEAGDATEATAPTLQALAAAMVLLRRCRVNAALTIQLFSHLFHYINAYCFNKLVLEPGTVSARWGAALSARLALLAAWAERQGLELAADCHLARTHQAARLIQGEYRTAEEVRATLSACVKLNSVQVRALLAPIAPPDIVDAAVAHARALADELYRADGREIRAEESRWLGAALLIPGDGFSAEVVRGVPPGLAEFVAPLQRGALCRLVHQPRALGAWSVYLATHAAHAQPRHDTRPLIVRLNKNSSGMGLSIVAAKGAGQSKLGIYIKSVVAGGAAAADGRLAAGDQLLSVDGHSLVGITQEKAAEYLVRTGPTVTLEVAKQGAVLHGLATLLHQPAYNQRQGGALRRASERDLPSRLAAEPVKPSKSTPALHHAPPSAHPAHPAHIAPQSQPQPAPSHTGTLSPVGSSQSGGSAWAGKSRSSHNLTAAAQGDAFYQNLSSVNSHPQGHQDRWWNYRTTGNRPQSAHFSAAGSEPQSEPSPHQQINSASSASIRAAKLAEMSEEVTRRQQQQQQQQLLSQQKQHTLPHQHQHAQLNQHQSPLAHQMSPQQMQHQHQNQIAHQANHIQNQMAQTGYQSSQLDLQLNQLHQNQAAHHMSPMSQQGAMGQHLGQFSQSQMHIHQSAAHYPQQGSPQLPAAHPAHPAHPAHSQNMHQQYAHSQLQSSPNMYHNQHQQPQRYDWHPPGPPSPQRSQPPVAPKPQGARRSETEDEQIQQLQQSHSTTTVQPEDERYVASALEPPAVSVYPAGGSAGAGGAARQQPAHNPWQREERERQAEARRVQARARRDATIAQLLALGASRTPVQNQQLRALQLERDFERRATQHDHEEGGGAELGADEESDSRSASRSPSPEHQMHMQQQQQQQLDKHSQQMQQHTSQIQQMAQHSHHMQQQQSTHAHQIQQQHLAQHSQHLHQQHSQHVQQQHSMHHSQQIQQSAQQQQSLPQQQQLQQPPKSILKSNPRSDITNGYAADTTLEESRMSELAESVSGLSVSGGAPAPPERGSSFAVMAGRRALSPAAYDAHAHRFITETERLVSGAGTSPGAPLAHTPGVIGAQEVYRDPRARRLAEQQARAAPAAVPETLSFKEKMKMFALEAGDRSTPKDKRFIKREDQACDVGGCLCVDLNV